MYELRPHCLLRKTSGGRSAYPEVYAPMHTPMHTRCIADAYPKRGQLLGMYIGIPRSGGRSAYPDSYSPMHAPK
eukprot:10164171-Heterocapsa_arctica.AAC.1